jgi:organic radical activating enzyme
MEYAVTGLSDEQKQCLAEGKLLPVMEMFMTLQGEGTHTGLASFFIRIGGCDIGCHWCDVKESWNASVHPLIPLNEIMRRVEENHARTVVITGGEPVYWNLEPLTSELKKRNIKIHLETSAAYPIKGHFDWICLSPKKNKHPLPQNWEKADELKVIIYNQHDFKWAEECRKNVKSTCNFYLQPEWSRANDMTPKIIEYIQKNPHWKLSLQTHKYLGIP